MALRCSRSLILKLLPWGLGLILLVLYLSWNGILPGEFFLRNLLENPARRQARAHQAHRRQRLLAFARDPASQATGQVVFLGSSTIEFMPLARLFPGRPALNRGLGEESLRELLDRLRQSLPPKPAGFIVYGGARDFHGQGAGSLTIARRMGRLFLRLDQLAPRVPVLVLGILPARDEGHAALKRLRQVNQALAALCQRLKKSFLPTNQPPLVTLSGRLAPAFSRDRWHLNQRGYQVLARWILHSGGKASAPLQP